MEDKELLELAAKAYGFGDPEGNFIWTESEYPRGSKTNGALWNYMGWCDTAELWNPLTDDGDALRLAVALEMHIALFGGAMESRVLADGDDWEVEGWECGKEEATRRAITRAAAQIGKEME